MKSAGNIGVLGAGLQMPHIHIFLVTPLSASYMASRAQTSIHA